MYSLKGAFKRYELQLQHPASLMGVSKFQRKQRPGKFHCDVQILKRKILTSALNFVEIQCQVLVKQKSDTECKPEFPLALEEAETKITGEENWHSENTNLPFLLFWNLCLE